jgi:hypothetical protein
MRNLMEISESKDSITDTANEIMFISQVLESLGLKHTKPIIVYIDNVEAILVAVGKSRMP